MGEDEEGTLATLTAHLSDLIEPCIADHRGRVVKTTGDGLLAEFASVVDAVRCAVAFQEGMAERNAGTSEDRRIEFRIGVNLGDVIVQDDDVYGDGVNVAARLEGLAEPGGIIVSGTVHEHARGKLEICFDDLGPQEVKNIADPIQVYRVRSVTADNVQQVGTEAPLALPDKPSIAVLPFQNMSGDAEQEFLADGVAEDIITALSRLRWLFVIARNSTFAYKGASPDVRDVARDLGVRYVLEGSVRRAGDRVRVTGQLIDATTGNHIWAERYDRDIAGIFELQDEITAAIVRAVDPEIQGAEQERALRKPPENLTAWDHYQRGLWYHSRVSQENLDKAREHLSAAIAADPGFAPAWAAKSFTVYLYVLYGWTDSPDDTLAEAQELAEKAISLDDKEPSAHFALGRVFTVRGEFSKSISQLEQALELNPNFAYACYALGFACCLSGRVEDSLLHFDEAIRQSPRDPWLYVYQAFKAVALAHLDRYDEALEFCAKSTRHQSGDMNPQIIYASVLGQMGRIDEARQQLASVIAKEPDLRASRILPAPLRVMFEEGREKFMDGLRKAGLPE
jgi:TolB-like protein